MWAAFRSEKKTRLMQRAWKGNYFPEQWTVRSMHAIDRFSVCNEAICTILARITCTIFRPTTVSVSACRTTIVQTTLTMSSMTDVWCGAKPTKFEPGYWDWQREWTPRATCNCLLIKFWFTVFHKQYFTFCVWIPFESLRECSESCRNSCVCARYSLSKRNSYISMFNSIDRWSMYKCDAQWRL